MIDRKVGTLGEFLFSAYCVSAGLTVNSSRDMDESGWDHIVEFNFERGGSDKPADLLGAPMECRIQVKSTDASLGRVDVTLSNMQRMVTNTVPYFFCFMEFNGKNAPEAVYLVHVGESLIERTLKRLRKNSALVKPKKLNDINLSVSYSEEDKLPLPNIGGCLRSRLLTYWPDGLSNYVSKKQKLVDELGYESDSHEMKITIDSDEPDSDFNNFMLGISDLPIKTASFFDNRFNIKVPVPALDMPTSGGVLSLGGDGEPITLELRRTKFKSGVKLKGFYRTSFGVNNIPGMPFFCFRSPLLTMTFADEKANLKWSFDSSVSTTLGEFRAFFEFMCELSAQKNLFLKMHGENVPKKGYWKINSVSSEALDRRDLLLVNKICSVVDVLDIDSSDWSMNFSCIANQADSIRKLHALLVGPTNIDEKVRYKASKESAGEGSQVAVIHTEVLELGDIKVAVLISIKGVEVKIDNDQNSLTNCTVELGPILIDEVEYTDSEIDVEFFSFKEELEGQGFCVLGFS